MSCTRGESSSRRAGGCCCHVIMSVGARWLAVVRPTSVHWCSCTLFTQRFTSHYTPDKHALYPPSPTNHVHHPPINSVIYQLKHDRLPFLRSLTHSLSLLSSQQLNYTIPTHPLLSITHPIEDTKTRLFTAGGTRGVEWVSERRVSENNNWTSEEWVSWPE